MDICAFGQKAERKLSAYARNMESLDSDVRSLIRLNSMLNPPGGDALNGTFNYYDNLRTAEAFIKSVTGMSIDEYKDSNDLNVRKRVAVAIDQHAQQLARLGVDWSGEMERAEITSHVANVYRRELLRNRGQQGKLFGLFTIPVLSGILAEPHRVIQTYEPAREVYSRYQMLNNFINHGVQILSKRVDTALDEFDAGGLDKKAIRKYMGYLDGQSVHGDGLERLAEEFLGDRPLATQYRQRLSKQLEREVEDDELTASFISTLQRFQREQWNIINYGVADPNSVEGYDPRNYKHSVLGFVYEAGSRLRELIDYRVKLIGIDSLSVPERRFYNKFTEGHEDAFRFRKDNYVPGKHEATESDFLNLIGSLDGNFHMGLAGFLHSREQVFETTEDFQRLLEQNLLSVSYTFTNTARYAMAATIGHLMEADSRWANNNSEAAVRMRDWALAIKHGLEERRNDPTYGVSVGRNISTALHSIGGVILANPSSSVANLGAGMMDLFAEFGFKDFWRANRSFKTAINNESSEMDAYMAHLAEEFVRKNLSMPGRMGDFLSTIDEQSRQPTEMDGLFLEGSKRLRDASMKVADAATGRGLLWIIPGLTMRGSENKLRSYAAPIMYDMMKRELQHIPLDQLTKEHVVMALKSIETDAFFRMNNALMDPASENKPYWVHAAQRNPENVPHLMMGSALSLWYLFRSVTRHNLSMLNKAIIDTGMDFKYGKLDKSVVGGAAPVGLLIATMGLTLYELLAGKKWFAPRISSVVNVNPANELTTVGRAAFAYMAPALNIDIDEATAEDVSRDLARLAGGVLAGGALDDVVRHVSRDSDGFGAFVDHAVGTIERECDLFALLPNALTSYSNRQEYYEAKKTAREALDNPFPWLNYSNDYLSFAARVIPMLSLGDAPEVTTEKGKDMGALVLSLFGINPTYERRFYSNSYKREFTMKRDYDEFADLARRKYPNGEGFRHSSISRAMNQLSRYGKLYPQWLGEQERYAR